LRAHREPAHDARPVPAYRGAWTPRVGRRAIWAVAALALAPAPGRATGLAAEWAIYRQRFLQPDGRVLDTGNAGISHSEGQGWGLILAAAAGDRPAFDQIRAWSRRILKRPRDNLHAWRFRPDAVPAVDDPNNATDGDLYIAWGLLLAHARWRHDPFLVEALAIADDVLRLTRRNLDGMRVLLPGATGFETPEGTILNPSYVVLPAFAALHRVAPQAGWDLLAQDGLVLLRQARFGAWGLSPDWVLRPRGAEAPLAMPHRWPPRFSYDAVRVPLLLGWAGETRHPALLGAHGFWSDPRWREPPAWADLVTGRVAEDPATPGMRAIAAFVAARLAGADAPVALPGVEQSPDYYSASLTMLTRLACEMAGLRVA
jgi:endo-1,4-beta-D-glucanase Y